MKTILFIPFLIFIFSACSCKKDIVTFEQGDVKIEVKTGDAWLHDFPLFLGINKKNPPQFAIWIEDTAGNYISTVFVTNKIATQGWIASDGNRRKEALPNWCYSRGVVYDDGLYLPTKDKPYVDGISGETPKKDSEFKININDLSSQIFVLKAEFNQSIDFNEFYPENAVEGDYNYSGGKMGSGQPALVYADTIDFSKDSVFILKLIGHSSPDGTDGKIYDDFETITSALKIVSQIKVSLIQ